MEIGEDSEYDDNEKPKKLSATQRAEMRASIPAIFVDTWSTLRWKGCIRITFGEYLNRNPHYRTAILMEIDEAENFAKHLLKAIAKQREEDSQGAAPLNQPPESAANQKPESFNQK